MAYSSRQTSRYQTLERERKSARRDFIVDGVLKTLPTICVLAFAVWFAIRFGDVIGTRLLPNIQGFKAFGVELTFAISNLQKVPAGASNTNNLPMNGPAREQIIQRASRLAPLIRNSRILWVDDQPENNTLQRNFLQSIGISVDCAQNNSTAYELLKHQQLNSTPYDLVISDYKRDPDHEPGQTGITLLEEMRKEHYTQDVIYFTPDLPNKPEGAFASTHYSSELFNFIFDVLEWRHA